MAVWGVVNGKIQIGNINKDCLLLSCCGIVKKENFEARF